MTNESNKSRKQAMLRKDWSVIPLKDEVSGNLSYEFTFPVGDDTMGCLELGNELSTREMSRSLARRTTLLPKRGAEALIQKLIGAAPKKFVVKAGQPGWKRSPSASDKGFVAFVTPGQITGPGAALFRSPASRNSRPPLGQCHVQGSGRQQLAVAGSHRAIPWAGARGRNYVRFGSRPGGRDATCRGRAWRAREADRRTGRQLGRLVRRVHGGRASRQGVAAIGPRRSTVTGAYPR